MSDTLPPRRPRGGSGSSPPDKAEAGPVRAAQEVREGVSPDGPTRSMPAETSVGPYRVEALVGEGGMGKVYRCYDPQLKRRVAVKVLHERYGSEPEYRARFQREAETVAALSHPAIAQIHAIGSTDGGALYLVMEYVDGPSVGEVLERGGRFTPERAAAIARDIAAGLGAALRRGVIHRDIKPSNILLTADGGAKLVDFGLAKDLSARAGITDHGIVVGTPHYMSPEQGRGRSVDHRSDLYSLGATLYHMVTGRPPFEGNSQVSVIVSHVEHDPPPPHALDPCVPPRLSLVIGTLLAREPGDRYQRYEDLIEDLDRVAAGKAPRHAGKGRFGRARSRRRNIAIAAGVAAAACALALGILTFMSPSPSAGAGSELGRWYLAGAAGGDTLDMDFSRLPGPWERVFSRAFAVPDSSPEPPLRLAGPVLDWRDFEGPLACRYVFSRLEEIQVEVRAQAGLFDFAVAVVDPLGNSRRAFILRLRPEGPTPDPLAALLSGDLVPCEPPLPPLGRLPPPYSVLLAFSEEGDATRVRLRVSHSNSPQPRYSAETMLHGTEWAQGAVVFKAAPRRRPFRIALGRILLSGRLSGETLREVPWLD